MTEEHRFRRPESVLVVVHTRCGQALLLSRADRPDSWQSVTGSLEWEEEPSRCAARELKEETGLVGVPSATGVIRRFRIFDTWLPRYAPGTEWNVEHEFRWQVEEPVAVRIHPEEHLEYRWVPLSQAAEMVFSWTNREALAALGALQ